MNVEIAVDWGVINDRDGGISIKVSRCIRSVWMRQNKSFSDGGRGGFINREESRPVVQSSHLWPAG